MHIPDGEIIDNTRFFQHNADGDYTIETEVHQEVSGILEQNKQERETTDGFTDKRTMRKIMSLSSVEYLIALQQGYALDDTDPMIVQKEVRRYLRERGKEAGHQTVRNILTPGRSGNIIVK